MAEFKSEYPESRAQDGPHTPSQILCQPCSNIDVSKPTAHHNIWGLRKSASNGCVCCAFIYESINGQFGDQFRENITIWPDDPGNQLVPLLDRTLMYKFPSARIGMDSRFEFRNHDWIDYGNLLPTFELVVRGEEPSLTEENPQWIPRFMERASVTEASFALMSRWLETCISSHERCKQAHVLLPKRVLDLKGEHPVLVLGNGREEPYAALSHCWGTRPPLRTTTTSLALHMASIMFSTLPRTFQDAILVARKLKIRYLWIDSLCIVQDDTEDWLAESAKMMDYYANAHVTVSALRSGDSQEGFLGDRIIDQQILVSAEKKLYIRSKREQLRTMFFHEPLNSRAWTLQERLISTRIIHFGKHEMIWECNSCSARESGLTDLSSSNLADVSIPPNSGNFGPDPKFSIDPSLMALQIVKVPEPDPVMKLNFKRLILEASAKNIDKVEVWEHLVKDYLTRGITRPTDRLPAISALARMLFEGSDFTYLAGILKEWPEGLMWDLETGSDETTIARGGVPSWSWAAAVGPIRFIFPEPRRSDIPRKKRSSTFQPEIIDFSIDTVTQDQFSQPKSGILLLSAYLWHKPESEGSSWANWRSPAPATQNSPRRLLVGLDTQYERSAKGIGKMVKCIDVELDAGANAYRRIGRLKSVPYDPENAWKRSLVVLA